MLTLVPRLLAAFAFAAALSLTTTPAAAQADPASETHSARSLRQRILNLDERLFGAYNRCDLEAFAALIAEDVEFYHDQTGLARGRETIVQSLRENICGKVRRVPVDGTMEVHPLKGYGAIQIGVHRFTHPGRDDTEPVGEARFVHVWRESNGAWELTRIMSFGHQSAPDGKTP